MLDYFDSGFKDEFAQRMKGTFAETSYDNIVNNRHAFAHSSPVQVTFAELKKWYEGSKQVMRALADVLGVAAP